MRVVYVTYFKSCTVTAQTTRAEGRHTTFVRNLSQRILLVHKLAQGVRSEVGIDNAGNSLSVDEVSGSEDFVIAYVHAFADSTAHASQTDIELVV